MKSHVTLSFLVTSLAAMSVAAAPAGGQRNSDSAATTYTIDSEHTYPSFEADHFGGLSTWRGKFNSTSGEVTLDREAQTGKIDVTIDAASIDLGHDKLNEHARSEDMLDVAKYPTVKYVGTLTHFKNGLPTAVEGMMTLHGITKAVPLTIDRFKCMKHPMSGKEVCGANAVGRFNREDFGIGFGKGRHGMEVGLNIQVEAARAD